MESTRTLPRFFEFRNEHATRWLIVQNVNLQRDTGCIASLPFVRMGGLEPPRRETPDPKSGAATITPHALNTDAKIRLFL